ncbi:MAG: hypothetical protein HOO06_11260 [Bdellovibrionaceae bacterium]|nr:hypothetical protein [Pseudobdellovibrionaceae bacterium]
MNMEAPEEPNFEIDLSPLLALMVTLIPMMLLATVFVKVSIVETPLPQAVKQAIEKDRKKKKREIVIELKMSNSKEFDLIVKYGASTKYRKQVAGKNFKENLNQLHKHLVQVKKQHPKIFQIQFLPSEEVAYEDIVKVMDEARKIKANDEPIFLENSEQNKPVELKVMFPDLIFKNLLEG